MKALVNVPEAVSGDMGVNLSRADIGVAEQFLDHAKVGAVFQEMRGKAVARQGGGDIALNSRAADAALDSQPHRDRREWRAAFRQENARGRAACNELGPACVQIPLQSDNCFSTERDNAFFVSFPDHIDKTCVQVKLFEAD